MKAVTAAARLAALAVAGATAGCVERIPVLQPQGLHARAIADLFWIFLAILALVWIATNIMMALALKGRRPPGTDPLHEHPERDHRMTIMVALAVAATGVVVIAFTALSYAAQNRLFTSRNGETVIRITGRQWWWQITYMDGDPSRTFTTANEFKIPVNEPVRLELESNDVIHSFWIPSLAGKMDLIPGRQNVLQIMAERPGTYVGQCAEFCGIQHAHMGLRVTAEPREIFDTWRNAMLSPANKPTDPERAKGLEILVSKPCVMCHEVRGTPAGGKVGPDLTHLADRTMIGAGVLPNTRGNLAAWIVDPQGIKPGVHMPLVKLEAHEVEPLARYLEGLH